MRVLLTLLLLPFWAVAQLKPTFVEARFLRVEHFALRDSTLHTFQALPLFSYVLNDKYATTERTVFQAENEKLKFVLENKLSVTYSPSNGSKPLDGDAVITFTNTSADTVRLRNVVPLGESKSHVYITGLGTHSLSRAHLFRPNFAPVNVILPDNAWELGFSAVTMADKNVCALMRRVKWEKAIRRRFEPFCLLAAALLITFGLKRIRAIGRRDSVKFSKKGNCMI